MLCSWPQTPHSPNQGKHTHTHTGTSLLSTCSDCTPRIPTCTSVATVGHVSSHAWPTSKLGKPECTQDKPEFTPNKPRFPLYIKVSFRAMADSQGQDRRTNICRFVRKQPHNHLHMAEAAANRKRAGRDAQYGGVTWYNAVFLISCHSRLVKLPALCWRGAMSGKHTRKYRLWWEDAIKCKRPGFAPLNHHVAPGSYGYVKATYS